MEKIIFAAHDKGGMDSLLPVIKKIRRSRKFKALLLLEGPAKILALENGWKCHDAATLNRRQVEKIVAGFKPSLIFTGTSSGVTVEKRLWKIARARGIPSAAIMDFWVNYHLQFSFSKDEKLKNAVLPDFILVMDDLARREMIAEGFPLPKIIISGNPHFESFRRYPAPPKRARNTVAFIDQHISELTKKGIHEDLGFDEKEVFRDLLRALQELRFQGKVALRFHPGSEDRTRYDAIIANSPIKVEKVSLDVPLRKFITESRAVVGMTSMALFEAALGGKLVLSYQPHPKRKVDPLISNRLGLSHFAYNHKDLKKTLGRILKFKKTSHKHTRLIELYTKSGATNKVISFIEELVHGGL